LKHRTIEFWLTLILLLATVVSSIAAYVYWYRLTFFVGSYLFIHWVGLVATAFVAVIIPIHIVLKRKTPQHFKTVLKVHTVGNLFAFLLISIHFSQNLGRLAGALGRLGAGFALYIVLAVIVATGIMERFQAKAKITRYVKRIHKYTAPILYLVILIHILEGFNIL
jgi:hypothetical protein